MGFGSGIRDQRSGIRKEPIPDPGSRGQKGTRSRIRIRNTVFILKILFFAMLKFYLQALFQPAQHIYEKREGSRAGSGHLTNKSVSGRPKNKRILRIRIPNTTYLHSRVSKMLEPQLDQLTQDPQQCLEKTVGQLRLQLQLLLRLFAVAEAHPGGHFFLF
jgi:hypothetical protein